MKIDPISNHERAYIIAQLARTGKWAAKRMGAEVRIVRFKSESGNRIQYAIRLKSAWVHGQEPTAARAIAAVNETLIGSPRRQAPPRIPAFQTQRSGGEWLPYKDAEL